MADTDEDTQNSPSLLRKIGKFLIWATAFTVMIGSLQNSVLIILAMAQNFKLLLDMALLLWLCINLGLFILSIYLQIWLTTGKWPDSQKLALKYDIPAKEKKAGIFIIGMLVFITVYLTIGFLVTPYLQKSFFLFGMYLMGLFAVPLWLAMEYNRIMFDIEPGPYRKIRNILLATASLAIGLILVASINPVVAIVSLSGFTAAFLYLEYSFSKYLNKEIWK